MADIVCLDCRWRWPQVDEHPYIRKTSVEPVNIVEACPCPECGEDALDVFFEWCPRCDRQCGYCICDDPEAQRREQEDQEFFESLSEEELEAMVEDVQRRVRERVAEQEESLEEIRERHRAQREELEEMGRRLLEQYVEDDDT